MEIDVSTVKNIINYLGYHPGECVGEYVACQGCNILREKFTPVRELLEHRLEEYTRILLTESYDEQRGLVRGEDRILRRIR